MRKKRRTKPKNIPDIGPRLSQIPQNLPDSSLVFYSEEINPDKVIKEDL